MTTPDLSPSTAIGRRTASRLAVLLAGAAAALAITLLLAASGERAPLVLPHIGGGTASSPSVVPNAGQTAGAVRFEARAGAGAIYFTRSAVVLAAPGSVLRLRHEGTSGDVALRALDRRPGVVNVLRGERSRWRTGLPTYGAVLYRGLYPGVDLRVDGEVRGGGPWVRPTYAVAAHTSPSAIRWRYAGAASVRVDRRTGELQVLARAGAAPVVLAPPVAWQMLGGARVPVPVDYRAAHDGSVGFTVGRHDRGQPLLISGVPAAQRAQAGAPRLRFSTFLGGTQWDEAYGLALDPRGGAFIAGFSQSRDFPTAGRPSGFRGVQDAVVSHFDVNGRLVYSTYLGGSRTDTGQGIAVDAAGNAYVTGRTESPDFPVLRAMQPRLRGHNCQGEPCHDAFVTKLDARGRPVYSTFFGGSTNEEGWGIAVDGQRRAYVYGNTDSVDLPTRNAVSADNRSRPCARDVPCPFDAFVARLSADGRTLQFGSYLGGKDGELAGGIAVDRQGAMYVTGTTDSTDFPLRNARQRAIRGGRACGPPPGFPCEDAFITKIAPAGRRLVWSTFLGGSKPERGTSIAVDQAGAVHAIGLTKSTDFPTRRAVRGTIGNSSCRAQPPAQEECDDGYLTVLSPNGRNVRFSTYIGGNAEDQALAVAVARDGQVIVGGSTDSRAFPVRNALQPKLGGAIDGFLMAFGPGGALRWSTYLGGSENERVHGVGVDGHGAVTAAGRTDSPDFPALNARQPRPGGDIDAFVTRVR